MYEKMYYTLFHGITDAMELIEVQKHQEALSWLELACQNAEKLYISQNVQ